MATSKEHTETTAVQGAQQQSAASLTKYRTVTIAAILAIIVIVAGIIIYRTFYSAPREEKASTAIAKGQELFGDGKYEEALKGDNAGYTGFLSVAEDYSGTAAGNLARLYAGLCYAKMEKWEDAVNSLEQFDEKSDAMVSPAAVAALGNAYAHTGQLDQAVDCLIKAADKADNNSLSPTFLIQAAEILESQGKADEALALYKKVKEKYFNSMYYQNIDKYIERASHSK